MVYTIQKRQQRKQMRIVQEMKYFCCCRSIENGYQIKQVCCRISSYEIECFGLNQEKQFHEKKIVIFLVNDFFSWFRKKFAIIGITTVFKSTFFCFVPKVMNNIYRYISIELFQVFVHFLPLSFSIVFVFLYE